MWLCHTFLGFQLGWFVFIQDWSQLLYFQDYWKVEGTSVIYRVYRITVLQLICLREREYVHKNSLKSSIKGASAPSGFISQESRERSFYCLLFGKIILWVTFAKNIICLGCSRNSMKSSGRNSSVVDFFISMKLWCSLRTRAISAPQILLEMGMT